MSNFKMSVVALAVSASCGAIVADAAAAEHGVRDRWLKVGKALYKAGVRVEMLTKGTEKKPNEHFDAGLYDALRQQTIAGVSASKKGIKFDTRKPTGAGADQVKGDYVWTVADLLALTRDQLRDITDDVLKTQRRVYMQLIDGAMLGRIRTYVDRQQNPDKKREAKNNEKATPVIDAPLWDRALALMTEVNAQCLTWKTPKGDTAKGVIELQNAGLEFIARLGQVLPQLK